VRFFFWRRNSKAPAAPACCGGLTWAPVADLGHASGFDFDLGRCNVCGSYLICIAYAASGTYHRIPDERANYYLSLLNDDPARLRAVLRKWADG
jgi:hypothetical protein